ncbi:MAG: AAA family ATPase, partial [Armatimonadetes bacterium]|nr:AAA family ATPase [Armatimonadota bacterium]
MLRELIIENFALVDALTVEFQPGFTVLTGETGAGKSIIVESLAAITGERVPLS